MNCFMLQKCLAALQDGSDSDDINVQVSCACCGGSVKDSKIDHIDNKSDEP